MNTRARSGEEGRERVDALGEQLGLTPQQVPPLPRPVLDALAVGEQIAPLDGRLPRRRLGHGDDDHAARERLDLAPVVVLGALLALGVVGALGLGLGAEVDDGRVERRGEGAQRRAQVREEAPLDVAAQRLVIAGVRVVEDLAPEARELALRQVLGLDLARRLLGREGGTAEALPPLLDLGVDRGGLDGRQERDQFEEDGEGRRGVALDGRVAGGGRRGRVVWRERAEEGVQGRRGEEVVERLDELRGGGKASVTCACPFINCAHVLCHRRTTSEEKVTDLVLGAVLSSDVEQLLERLGVLGGVLAAMREERSVRLARSSPEQVDEGRTCRRRAASSLEARAHSRSTVGASRRRSRGPAKASKDVVKVSSAAPSCSSSSSSRPSREERTCRARGWLGDCSMAFLYVSSASSGWSRLNRARARKTRLRSMIGEGGGGGEGRGSAVGARRAAQRVVGRTHCSWSSQSRAQPCGRARGELHQAEGDEDETHLAFFSTLAQSLTPSASLSALSLGLTKTDIELVPEVGCGARATSSSSPSPSRPVARFRKPLSRSAEAL